MAKKSRTPPPPRRVQAPRQRRAEAPEGRRRRLLLIGAGAVAVAAIAAGAVVAWLVLGGGSSADAALRAAGCTVEKSPAMEDATHVPQLEEDFEYNTSPPTSGPHFEVAVVWDFYAEPVEQFRLVHNLEHGGLAVQYGEDVPETAVTQLRDWYLEDPNGIVVAPLPRLGDKIALTAWTTPDPVPGEEPGRGEGVVATCSSFDAEAFEEFKDTYGFRGPERFPRENLVPGT